MRRRGGRPMAIIVKEKNENYMPLIN